LAELVIGVAIKFCCSNKITSISEKTERYNLFIIDYAVYPLCLHAAAGNSAIESLTLIKLFKRNLCDATHVIVLWNRIEAAIKQEPTLC
jgi:hypothetical protein